MSGVYQFIKGYKVMDHRLLLVSESREMSEHIHCFLKNLELPDAELESVDVRCIVLNAPSGRVLISCPELAVTGVHALGRQSWLAFRHIFMRLAISGTPYYVIHASCVSDNNGNAILLNGCSDAGKTTLLAALLRNGYSLICDDYAFVDFDAAKLLAFPVGATITLKTLALVPELRPLISEACKFDIKHELQYTVNLGDIFKVAPPFSSHRPKHFFFLRPAFGEPSRIEPCNKEEIMWHLQRSRFANPPFVPTLGNCAADYQSKSLSLAFRLTEQASFHSVVNGKFSQTVDLIEKAIDEAKQDTASLQMTGTL